MKYFICSILLLASLQSVIAQDIPITTSSALSDYKTIAILPFRVGIPEYAYTNGDSTLAQLSIHETAFSLQVQEAFFNSITYDSKRWFVTVQNWRVTDSLLEKAGIDLLKAAYMDKQLLARLLKVDAVLVGQLDNIRSMQSNMSIATLSTTPLTGIPPNNHTSVNKQRMLFLLLFDGKEGDLIWNFERNIRPDRLIGNYFRLNEDLYKSFTKKFPFTR